MENNEGNNVSEPDKNIDDAVNDALDDNQNNSADDNTQNDKKPEPADTDYADDIFKPEEDVFIPEEDLDQESRFKKMYNKMYNKIKTNKKKIIKWGLIGAGATVLTVSAVLGADYLISRPKKETIEEKITQENKTETPKVEAPKVEPETPKVEAPKVEPETPKVEAPKVEPETPEQKNQTMLDKLLTQYKEITKDNKISDEKELTEILDLETKTKNLITEIKQTTIAKYIGDKLNDKNNKNDYTNQTKQLDETRQLYKEIQKQIITEAKTLKGKLLIYVDNPGNESDRVYGLKLDGILNGTPLEHAKYLKMTQNEAIYNSLKKSLKTNELKNWTKENVRQKIYDAAIQVPIDNTSKITNLFDRLQYGNTIITKETYKQMIKENKIRAYIVYEK